MNEKERIDGINNLEVTITLKEIVSLNRKLGFAIGTLEGIQMQVGLPLSDKIADALAELKS